MGFLEELRWRTLLHQTAGEGVEAHLNTTGRIAYCGFDPTSDSLTIGNFIPVKMLIHWQRAGHKPIVLMGGGTGLIGDPSGRDEERTLMTRERVEANVASQRKILERFLDFDPKNPNAAVVVNNLDWLDRIGYIEMLREVGKHFSINEMLQRDSVRKRLEEREHGISYTEFSYMLLQAYDFLHLRRTMNCTVQMSGSDQYGNIVAGMDLIRREFGAEEGRTFGVTAPLVTRSDGKKMGKSAEGAVWLSSDTDNRTSPYAFYQYFINLPDADAVSWLKKYTLLDEAAIQSLAEDHAREPHRRLPQTTLAQEMTRWVHGADVLARIESATQSLFSGEVRGLDESMLDEVFADVPHSTHAKTSLEGDGLSLVDLLPETTLVKSKREAREFLTNGAVSVNGEKVDADHALTTRDLLHGKVVLLRRGKKSWHAARFA